VRLRVLNRARQVLEDVTVPAATLFVRFEVFQQVGVDGAFLPTPDVVTAPLDSLVALVADRLAVLEAAEVEDEPAKPKPTPRKTVVKT
jgi:hypothetical protein